MPTSTQTGNGAGYLPRSHFKPHSVVKVNTDALLEIAGKAARGAAGGGQSTACKVLTTVVALCVVGGAVGTAVALTELRQLQRPRLLQRLRQLQQQQQRRPVLQQRQRRPRRQLQQPRRQLQRRLRRPLRPLLRQPRLLVRHRLPLQRRLRQAQLVRQRQQPRLQPLLVPHRLQLQRLLRQARLQPVPQVRRARQLQQRVRQVRQRALPQQQLVPLRQVPRRRLRPVQAQLQRRQPLPHQEQPQPQRPAQRRQLPELRQRRQRQQQPQHVIQPIGRLAAGSVSGYWSGIGTLAAQMDGVTDRTSGPGFNSGGGAPQFLQLDLPTTYSVSSVALLVDQSPPGNTLHQLSVGPNSGSLTVVTTLNGYTYAGQWINLTYNPPLSGVRVLRLNTISSPSWVAWYKFIVMGV